MTVYLKLNDCTRWTNWQMGMVYCEGDVPKWVKNFGIRNYQIQHATSTACRLELNVWLICGVNCSLRVLDNHHHHTHQHKHSQYTREISAIFSNFPRFAMSRSRGIHTTEKLVLNAKQSWVWRLRSRCHAHFSPTLRPIGIPRVYSYQFNKQSEKPKAISSRFSNGLTILCCLVCRTDPCGWFQLNKNTARAHNDHGNALAHFLLSCSLDSADSNTEMGTKIGRQLHLDAMANKISWLWLPNTHKFRLQRDEHMLLFEFVWRHIWPCTAVTCTCHAPATPQKAHLNERRTKVY